MQAGFPNLTSRRGGCYRLQRVTPQRSHHPHGRCAQPVLQDLPRAASAERDAGASTSGSGQAAAGSSSVEQAWALLTAFTQADFRGTASSLLADDAKRSQLRDALLVAYRSPYPQASWVPLAAAPAASSAASATVGSTAPDQGMPTEEEQEELPPDLLLGFMASSIRFAIRFALAASVWCPQTFFPTVLLPARHAHKGR